jgi:hypothetical protein
MRVDWRISNGDCLPMGRRAMVRVDSPLVVFSIAAFFMRNILLKYEASTQLANRVLVTF